MSTPSDTPERVPEPGLQEGEVLFRADCPNCGEGEVAGTLRGKGTVLRVQGFPCNRCGATFTVEVVTP